MLAMYLSVLDAPEEQLLFMQIYTRHRRAALGAVIKILGSVSLGEDAAQEGWMKVAKNFETFLSIPSEKQWPWIVTIMRNTAKTMLRQERRLVSLEDFHLPGPDDADPTRPTDRADFLQVQLARLPEEYRDVLIRRYFLQESCAEIGAGLRLTPSAVSMRLNRARNMLRELIEKEEYE